MNKLKWNFNQNTKLFIHENASENIVGEMSPILSRLQYVNEEIYLRGNSSGRVWARQHQITQLLLLLIAVATVTHHTWLIVDGLDGGLVDQPVLSEHGSTTVPNMPLQISDIGLTHEQLEMHGCTLSPVATDALVQKYRAISVSCAD